MIALVTWMSAISAFHVFAAILRIFEPYNPSVCYLDALPIILCNQIGLLLPAMLLTEHFGLAFNESETSPITLTNILVCSLVMTFGHDMLFYIGHRWLLHSQWGYTTLGHNLHHQSDAMCGITAMFMTPLDFIVEIVVPYLVPLVICGQFASGYLPNIVILTAGCLGGVLEHSSICYNKLHSVHHRIYRLNFANGVGSPGFMDWAMNTRTRS